MKKIISVFLVIALLLPMFNLGAAAYDASSMRVWDGTADTSWYTGGSDSYDIDTPEQLAGLSKLVNGGTSFKGVTINLTEDLLMNENPGEYEDWDEFPPKNVFTAIGFTQSILGSDQPFRGNFNGNGHTISGLYTNGEFGGLFGYISGSVIANVRVYESCLIGDRNGPYEGFSGGIAALAENCYIGSCEVNSCFVGAKGPSSNDGMHDAMAGGILGSAQTNNIAGLAAFITIGGMGVIFNPAIFEGASGGTIATTFIDSCKVVNTSVLAKAQFGDALAGGLIGYGHTGKMYDSFYDIGGGRVNAECNNPFGGTKYGLVAGRLFNYHLENVYYYNFDNEIKTWGVGSYEKGMFEQKDTSVGKTKAELKSYGFAEELGEAFEGVSGDYPRLTVMGELPKFKDSGIKRLSAPQNVTAKTDDMFITLSWDAVSGADGYVVSYSADRKTWLTVESKTTTCDIVGLEPDSKYYYTVQAVQNGINGRHSKTGHATTDKERLPAPTNVRCTKKGTDFLTIEWDTSEDISGALGVIRKRGFNLGISTDKTNWKYYNTYKSSCYTVKDLNPNTTYYITVAIYDDDVNAHSSEPVAFTTNKDSSESTAGTATPADLNNGKVSSDLPAPTNIRCTQGGTDSLRIEWDSSLSASDFLGTLRERHYMIGISADNKTWSYYDAYKYKYYTAKNLKQNTTYYFAVAMYDQYGKGCYSEPAAFTTKRDTSITDIPGDINNDSKISLTDVTLLLKKFVNEPANSTVDPKCDINGDGRFNLTDVTALLKKYVNS